MMGAAKTKRKSRVESYDFTIINNLQYIRKGIKDHLERIPRRKEDNAFGS
jgi:hypothetical protein